ncbi:MAG: hypothetical protein NZT92_14125 [Abditibacteriales bacterium]|nr:hypothetical protein [Abditibacteriales bacterium]
MNSPPKIVLVVVLVLGSQRRPTTMTIFLRRGASTTHENSLERVNGQWLVVNEPSAICCHTL